MLSFVEWAQCLPSLGVVAGLSLSLSPVRFAVVFTLCAFVVLAVVSFAFRLAGDRYTANVILATGGVSMCLMIPSFAYEDVSGDIGAATLALMSAPFLSVQWYRPSLVAGALAGACIASVGPSIGAAAPIVQASEAIFLLGSSYFGREMKPVSSGEMLTPRSCLLLMAHALALSGFVSMVTPVSALPAAAAGVVLVLLEGRFLYASPTVLWRSCMAVATALVFQSLRAQDVASYVSPALWASVLLYGPSPSKTAAKQGRITYVLLTVSSQICAAVAMFAMALLAARELEGALYIVPAFVSHVVA